MFERAKDITNKDKDIVFVLNADPFLEAGVDLDKLDGRVFVQVQVIGENGKKQEVNKLVRFFDL